ncbi:Outer membrane protein and related peptidoglycan-associated (lipo)proteins [Marinactinospora thermotolerans DSM 45154]|uniref:Outer membrane protein and related peptidoglycan-associated (Lipo)proteins n=1 Tax=Marinactinospora thermotolerans DSM 45154 TaxID=1122192 RepID=A0A1T4RPA7_9ACTN|nr:OmpA family protein [Marinactinospora thermotolerans]SKA17809.1 Outer membrane protein and related peptidoglycan-associated (lipo)proteins [Marinactinospora thermotolerans DSM 45154]
MKMMKKSKKSASCKIPLPEGDDLAKMDPNPLSSRSALLCIPIIAVTLLTTSCVGQPDSDPSTASTSNADSEEQGAPPGPTESDRNNNPIATSLSSATPQGKDIQLDIFSLERHSKEVLVLNMRITNKGDEAAQVLYTLSELGGEAASPDGVSLIDMRENKRYMPLKLTDGKTCHCSNWSGEENLAPGASINLWAAFPSPPGDVKEVAVATPVTPDFLDIPITDAISPNPEISDAPVSEARILDLRTFQDDTSNGTSRSESGDETTLILSSDVLFNINESELTSKANETLAKVAGEIDSSSTENVKIDGYTDNTGSDSINNPLSEERARAVEARLKELVSREGLTYTVSGHGSNDPIGDNQTEEGREKNRRVTVTFSK